MMLIFFSCNEQERREVIEQWLDGKTKTEIAYIDKEDSIYVKFQYYESGELKLKQEFVRGKLHGKEILYSESGIKVREFDYVEGEKNGIGTAWYESGRIAFQFKYKDDLYYDGTEYYEDGWPRVLVKFSAPGVREGNAIYFKEDGRIWMRGYFKNGKEDSTWTIYRSNGNPFIRIRYEKGVEMSRDTIRDEAFPGTASQ